MLWPKFKRVPITEEYEAEIVRLRAALKIIAHVFAEPATDYSRGVQQVANRALDGDQFVDTYPPYPAP